MILKAILERTILLHVRKLERMLSTRAFLKKTASITRWVQIRLWRFIIRIRSVTLVDARVIINFAQGPFAESVRDGFNEERLEYVDDICEEMYYFCVCVCMFKEVWGWMRLHVILHWSHAPQQAWAATTVSFCVFVVHYMFDCRYQQTRVDPACSSEETTTAALVLKSWLKVAFVYTFIMFRQQCPDF